MGQNYTTHLGSVIEINPASISKHYPYDEIEYVDISSVDTGYFSGSTRMLLVEAPSRAKRLVEHGDTILATIRPNLRSFLFIKNPPVNVVVSTGFAVLHPSHKIDARFLYYTVTDQKFTDYLTANAKGSAYPAVDSETIARAEIFFPPLLIQQKITAILSAYDDLIENNLRRIKILEEMAQNLYREWFVRFRFPVHQKVKMVDSPLGKVPEGWEVRNLRKFGNIVLGKTPSKAVKEFFGSDMPFIKLPDMHGKIFCLETSESLSLTGVSSQPSKTVPPKSLCISCIGTPGVVCITTQPSQTNQQINTIIPNSATYVEFLYFALLGLKEKITQIGASGATMVNLNKEKFGSLEVISPTDDLFHGFHEYMNPFFDMICVLQTKNIFLHKMRNLLLPKLISGELDVSELDIAILEEVST